MLDEQAGNGSFGFFGNAVGGGLGAVDDAEAVADEYVAQRGVFFGKRRVVFLFAFVEAAVFQHDDVASGNGRGFVEVVFDERHVFAEQVAKVGGDGGEAEGFVVFAFGRTAEVRHDHHGTAVVEDVADGRQRCLDAGVAGDFAVFERDVEIQPHQDAFAVYVDFTEFSHGYPLLKGIVGERWLVFLPGRERFARVLVLSLREISHPLPTPPPLRRGGRQLRLGDSFVRAVTASPDRP